jgi:hypothetical protein
MLEMGQGLAAMGMRNGIARLAYLVLLVMPVVGCGA